MKKQHDYKELSSKKCVDCNKYLKKNLVENNPNATRCYCCDRISKGKLTSQRKTKFGVKTIDWKKIQASNRKRYKFKFKSK